MPEKNKKRVLLLSFLITCLISGGLFWLITRAIAPNNPNSDSQSQLLPPSNNISSTFAEVKNVPSGLFSYGGSTTWAPLRKEIDVAIQFVWPKFQLRYTDPIVGSPSSTSGIEMLLNNQLAFSQSSRPLRDIEYQQASQKGFSLKEIPVAIDGIAFAVNPNLNITGLTIPQIKDIYLGKITNWNQVGGPNLAIAPYSRNREYGGTVDFFVANVLQGENFAANVRFIPTTTVALRKIAGDRGGIYYASAPEIVPQCTVKAIPIGRQSNELVSPFLPPFVDRSQCPAKRNQLNIRAFKSGEYPITRRLFVIVKQNNQADEKAGNAYAKLLLADQGQDLISKAGFVKIK